MLYVVGWLCLFIGNKSDVCDAQLAVHSLPLIEKISFADQSQSSPSLLLAKSQDDIPAEDISKVLADEG